VTSLEKILGNVGKGEPIEIVCRGMMGSNTLVRHHIEGAITDPARRYIVLGLHSASTVRESQSFFFFFSYSIIIIIIKIRDL
jgi:hypothetical protein